MKKRVRLLLLAGIFTISSMNMIPISLDSDAGRSSVTVKAEAVEEDQVTETEAKQTEAKQTEAKPPVVKETEAPKPQPQPETTAPVPETEPVKTEPETEAPKPQPETEPVKEPVKETEKADSGAETEKGTGSEETSESEVQSESPSEESNNEKRLESKTTVMNTKLQKQEIETESESETESETEKVYQNEFHALGTVSIAGIRKNTHEIYDILTKKMKLNHAAACGILANMQYDSNFSPSALGDKGLSYGLCQWHMERLSEMITYCVEQECDYKKIDGQMAFLYHDLQEEYKEVYDYMKEIPDTAQGAYDAAYYWYMHYDMTEEVKDPEFNADLRGKLARDEYYPKKLGVKVKSKISRKVYEKEQPQAQEIMDSVPEEMNSFGVQKRMDFKIVEEMLKLNDTIQVPEK